jgi:Flp pilus assembly pilin Flp
VRQLNETSRQEKFVSTAKTVKLRQQLAEALEGEEGQGLVEYALVLLFIAVIAVAVIAFLGPGISNAISNIATSL